MITTFRVVCALVGLCALFGYIHQEQLVVELKHQGEAASDSLTSANRYMLEREQIQERVNSTECETPSTTATTSTATPSSISINASNPLFVLSLPNHADLAVPRFFECADALTLGRHWTGPPKTPKRVPIGQCMRSNIKNKRNKPPMDKCGDFSVFTDLQFLKAPFYKVGRETPSDCFDPVFYPNALEKLYEHYPTSTILNVVRDPVEWYESLSPQLPTFWNDWCNELHDNQFPTAQEVGHQRPMVGFYMEYQHRLRQFAKEHPTMNYIEIDLQHPTGTTATKLEQALNIPSKCWTNSMQGNIQMVPDPNVPNVLQQQPRPNTVGWPMLVTAMPKAGTSTIHNYFRCGLGDWTSAHQWTTLTREPHKTTPVGECLIENTNNDHYPFLGGCGDQLVWGDTGVLRKQQKICYYPFLHRQGLERFYKSYPYGSILNTVRNTTSWVSSALRWSNLPLRWVDARCEGFPTNRSVPVEEWEAFYDGVHDIVRQFAKEHPTLTYIEVPLNDQTGAMLNDVFRFPDECWGHANVNKKNQEKSKNDTVATTA